MSKWRKVNPPSGFTKPEKPTWTIKRNHVQIDIWFQPKADPPYYRSKLSVVRKHVDPNLPWERIQTLVSRIDAPMEEDELFLAAILIKEAHSWVEAQKAATSTKRQSSKSAAIRRAQRRQLHKAARPFEPIQHEPQEVS